MEGLKAFQHMVAVYTTLLAISVISANAQISTPCTTSMISSFTPCLNFITGSTSGNGSSPTAGCCSSLRSLTSTTMDCACLIITGSVPLQLPINRTLAISLPRACNMGSVPIQCKASGTPLPAPGPVLLGPTLPPPAAAPLSPRASKAAAATLAPAPEPETAIELSPASPPVDSETPTTTTPGIRPVLTPSASNPSYISSPLLLIVLGIMFLKCY
ncbi:hypothetical protein VitviT2T_009296 [Vitis vinifera]|uniref:Bifunctional inhibitor/plant lipid transfer protein/seed storage helical domain-containing protein n=2 Tax=Vitis vinifera TaxID=29760 RepID=A0ABY9C5Y1_VITVI|nr:non-specific lipid transfer protein GPI-anchored 16 [Vitis vinifera]WJZ90128.1 hypothetical protein VitviT2T_009296 [Vitis vinifera]|eukprot:XP_003632315.1 PREDICTED: protein YLS3 [Vitis vinifera]